MSHPTCSMTVPAVEEDGNYLLALALGDPYVRVPGSSVETALRAAAAASISEQSTATYLRCAALALTNLDAQTSGSAD